MMCDVYFRTSVPLLHAGVPSPVPAQASRAHAHRRETVPLHHVQQEFHTEMSPQCPHVYCTPGVPTDMNEHYAGPPIS